MKIKLRNESSPIGSTGVQICAVPNNKYKKSLTTSFFQLIQIMFFFMYFQ